METAAPARHSVSCAVSPSSFAVWAKGVRAKCHVSPAGPSREEVAHSSSDVSSFMTAARGATLSG